MSQLAGRARSELTPTRGGELWALQDARDDPADDSLRESVADPAQCTLVGTIDDVVLGYAVASIDRLDDASRLAVIDDVYVDVDARGVGIGRALIDALLEWATAQHCRGIDARVLPGNRAGKNFFEGAGLVARAIVVHRPLDGREGE